MKVPLNRRFLAIFCSSVLFLGARSVRAQPKLDLKEPPFAFGDFSWLDGNNRQPASLLTAGPATFGVYVDGYYLYQFRAPIDHTAFPSTVAPRHNEISINLASMGVDLTGLDGPIGRLFVQYGSNVDTDAGQDTSTSRGFYLTKSGFQFIQQAAAGWHFHALHGINVEAGIMPSYIGMESYLPEENWTYLRPWVSDATPYYLSALRIQIFPSDKLKLELWAANGWQSFGQWHEGRSGAYLINYRPSERVSLTHSTYFGQDQPTDATAVRMYTDNYLQWQAFKRNGVPRSVALTFEADAGYETRSQAQDGVMAAGVVATRFEWTKEWMTTLRADMLYDRAHTVIQPFPAGSPYALPDLRPFLGEGFSATLDYWPSPWIVYRLEYMHRAASIPYFSGHGGITGPGGMAAQDPASFIPDLRRTDDRIVVNVTLRL